MNTKKMRRVIIFLFLSFLLITLFVGLIIAEKNTKYMYFGEDQKCISMVVDYNGNSCIKLNFLGIYKNINISDFYNKIDFLLKKTNDFILMFKK